MTAWPPRAEAPGAVPRLLAAGAMGLVIAAWPLGLLQPVADGVKLIFKEELVPSKAYKFAFMLAPVLTMAPAKTS